MSLSDRIRIICENKKIKNIDLVELGCGSQQTVSFVLSGKQKPNSQFLEIFLKAYSDIDARWLLTGDDLLTVEEVKTQYGFCKECIKKDGIIEFLQNELIKRDKIIGELRKKVSDESDRMGQAS
ncbi:MAG TPA: hypothetical protein PL124_05490 [Candidatus Cloacimonadota bacterium]|nr:hypothetical protein [Candidatus Cloacimonadota bacterium]HPS38850.1 hypothetical protein [Candidatus Cloacimonadota bacterium]